MVPYIVKLPGLANADGDERFSATALNSERGGICNITECSIRLENWHVLHLDGAVSMNSSMDSYDMSRQYFFGHRLLEC